MKLLESKYATPRLYIGTSSDVKGMNNCHVSYLTTRPTNPILDQLRHYLLYSPMPIPSSSISGKAGTEIALELAEDAICWRTWPESSEV